MVIQGLQKLTLLDFPGRVACTVFLKGCNFRCPFCHNAPLVIGKEEASMPKEELLKFLKKRIGVLDGVCITGGEPLLNPGIADLLLDIKALGYAVKVDTNGSRPEMLEKLISLGAVDKFAVDIKSAPDKYPLAVGAKVDIEAIKQSVSILLSGKADYEFRTTVVKPIHTEYDFYEIAKLINGAKEYYLQAFSGSGEMIKGEGFSAYSKEEMENFRDIVKPFVKHIDIRGI